MFTHTAKDVITIGAFTATLDDFLLLEPSYRLPNGALWQFYVPGDKHLVGYGLFQRDDGSAWADGDVYLANETAYATAQPDTSPNVPGFELALVAAFGGDFLAINSLYAGWPLLRDMLEAAQWSVADFLLTNAYTSGEITTDTYTAIVATAHAYYIPMALQGRPGVTPLNILDEVTALTVLMDGTHQTDAMMVGASEGTGQIIIPILTSGDTVVAGATDDTAVLALPITILSDDTATAIENDAATPTLVIT